MFKAIKACFKKSTTPTLTSVPLDVPATPPKVILKRGIKPLKEHLKTIAANIRSLKKRRKGAPNDGYVEGLLEASYNFRVHHVAYCLLRGRTLEQIENTRLKNPPNPVADKYLLMNVERVMAEYKEVQDETTPLRSCP